MKIKAYKVSDPNLPIVAPQRTRAWQDDAGGGSYRCLPLVMSNQLGLHICSDRYVSAYWNGGGGLEDVVVTNGGEIAVSHFGLGVLTFHVSYFFRTPANWNLLVGGPVNWPKRGIVPLEGLVETDAATHIIYDELSVYEHVSDGRVAGGRTDLPHPALPAANRTLGDRDPRRPGHPGGRTAPA